MRLEDYLKEHMSAKELARKVGCSIPALYNYINGREPRLAIALKIIRHTKGKVKLRDLAKREKE